jgi:primosomal protein N' (replication factor Y)
VKNGDFPIVLGSRGAIFSPIENPGLIVIDEEHEWTYKQGDQAPRYHARAVAERISEETGAVLVLGSATPEISSYRAAKSGNYRLLHLPDRVGRPGASESKPLPKSQAMAKVEIVDMREERADGHFEMLSRRLIDTMAEALKAGTDLNCGGAYKALNESLSRGLVDVSDVDTAISRTLAGRFGLGQFDPPDSSPWRNIR